MIKRFFAWLTTPGVSAFERGRRFCESELAKGRKPEELAVLADGAIDHSDFDRGIEHCLRNREETTC